jgi:transposase
VISTRAFTTQLAALFLNTPLKSMDRLFAAVYAKSGRDSIAPQKLLRPLMLEVLYRVRSERMLVEQLGYTLLFRWFIGVSIHDGPWDHSTFSKPTSCTLGSKSLY